MSKTRKTYTAEFKLQAVRMVTDQHLAVAEVARRLGVREGRLHDWLKAFRAGGAELAVTPAQLAMILGGLAPAHTRRRARYAKPV